MSFQKERPNQEVNAGSMADIAFLLLIFFLVTTQILTNKGIPMILPDKAPPVISPVHERNLFKIQINSLDQIMVEDERFENIDELHQMVYDFVLNFGDPSSKSGSDDMTDLQVFNSLPPEMKNYILSNLKNSESSDGPSKAVVSIKTDRGSGYARFIEVMDQVQKAYYRIYGERVGLTDEQYRKLNRQDAHELFLYEQGKKGINKGISLAEPSNNVQN
uniref:ExbD/TolR family protein n=1 Tax=Roseivirga sp. TaxID=1964215 RepID=UPI004048517C